MRGCTGLPLACSVVLLLLGGGCREAGPPNLVLISIDSLRADRLGCYGAERDTSPAMDRLAADGVRFETALAPTSWTLPSHVTLLTGLSIPAHRVTAPVQRIDTARTLLAQHLTRLGYETAGFVSAPFLARAYGFDRGFSVYTNFANSRAAAHPPPLQWIRESHADETAPQVIGAALEWLGERDSSATPFFLFVHLWDVHYDYIPPEPYDAIFDPDYQGELDVRDYSFNRTINEDLPERDLQHLRALYDGEIRWLDSQLEPLLDALRERPDSGRTLISLVSDHGDEFFEHRRKGHRNTLFEESVRVPWILAYPGGLPPGTTIGGVVSLEDVAPTLLGLLGAPPLPEATGRNLSAQIRLGRSPRVPVLLSLEKTVALRGTTWKVIAPGRGAPIYYDLARDPGERNPRSARRFAPGALRELERRMAVELSRAKSLPWDGSEPAELDPELQEKLRQLGYVE
jgi:arylsulfatase A-like enzyme